MTATEILAQWDGPVTVVLAIFVWRELHEFRKELREFRKANARLIELLARQDERTRLLAGRSKRPTWMTETPAGGIPTMIENEGDEK